MEIMEEGNLMDRVRILLQRDMDYYQKHQTVLQENLCPGVVGGLLDFPHYASFAAVKMVLWWEEDYTITFRKASGLLERAGETAVEMEEVLDEEDKGCGGIAVAKTAAPSDFVTMVSESASQLLEHLHRLSQEALDHADLTVLTGTIGAAALIRNCLWCYNEQLKNTATKMKKKLNSKGSSEVLSVHGSYRQFHEMAEALAERLLDLHCRLLSLYVLQDADCLHWEDPRPFFEGERGSFVIQMWWLYMQGTREDLWNTVPPKMAQRVLAGMLNESLTILTVRYTQAEPSGGRSSLLVTDVSNLLLCVRQLLPAICSDGAELTGCASRNKVLRDVHAKCHELLICLILRGSPLGTLYKVFRKGLKGLPIFSKMDHSATVPWLVLTSPHLFPTSQSNIQKLPDAPAIALEISVLVAQPQASWPLLLKVLTMRCYKVTNLILHNVMQQLNKSSIKPRKSVKKRVRIKDEAVQPEDNEVSVCGSFLCGGSAECSLGTSATERYLPPGVIVTSLVYIVSMIGNRNDVSQVLLPTLEKYSPNWGASLDRHQVWNQNHPPWLNALLFPFEPILKPVVKTLLTALCDVNVTLKEGVILAVDYLTHLADCFPSTILQAVEVLEDALPADVHPLVGSVLMQMVIAALYSQLMAESDNPTAIALAEALCSLDRTGIVGEKIDVFLLAIKECAETPSLEKSCHSIEVTPHTAEVLVSNLLLAAPGRHALKVMWQYMQHSWQWIMGQLGVLEPGEEPLNTPPLVPSTASRPAPTKLLHTMFHMGHRHFDQLLAGTWELDWNELLRTPLSLTPERLWSQLSRRSEFHESPSLLSEHDATVVATLAELFQSITLTPVHKS